MQNCCPCATYCVLPVIINRHFSLCRHRYNLSCYSGLIFYSGIRRIRINHGLKTLFAQHGKLDTLLKVIGDDVANTIYLEIRNIYIMKNVCCRALLFIYTYHFQTANFEKSSLNKSTISKFCEMTSCGARLQFLCCKRLCINILEPQ